MLGRVWCVKGSWVPNFFEVVLPRRISGAGILALCYSSCDDSGWQHVSRNCSQVCTHVLIGSVWPFEPPNDCIVWVDSASLKLKGLISNVERSSNGVPLALS